MEIPSGTPIQQTQKSKVKFELKLGNIDVRYIKKGGKPLQYRPHFHTDIEMVYMIHGETTAGADSQRAMLRDGDLFVAFPNQIHFYQSYADEEYFLFIFKSTMIPEFAEIFARNCPGYPVLSNANRIPHLEELLLLLVDSARRDDMNPTYLAALQRGYLLSLFSIILSNIPLDSVSPQESGVLRNVIAYCAKHYAGDLSLSTLEKELHISKYYISHLFTDKLKMRFNDYVHSIRIHEACKLLRQDHVNITDIVGLVGFNSARTFNRTFTNQIGLSPSEFRKKHQESSAAGKVSDS